MNGKTRDPQTLITQEQASALLSYDPLTGHFCWLVDNRGRKAGDIAGARNSKGYIEICLLGKRYLAHRLAFLMQQGLHPVEVDHIDGCRDNNCWENLRNVTPLENARNQKLSSNNRSGMYGVIFCKKTGDWLVHIQVNGKTIRVGRYQHKFFAKQARKAAEIKYGYHPNHGRVLPQNSASN